MKLIENLTQEKYEEFCKKHKEQSHFLHSYVWGKFQEKERGVIPHYVGYEDSKHNLVAVALLLERKLVLNYTYFYSPRGYVIDYNNKELLKEFTESLKEFAKKRKALFIKIDPDVKLHDLDIEGNIQEENNNEELIQYLKTLGYKHLGFNKNFENNQPRYTFRLSLEPTIEEITKAFHPTTKKIINKGNPYNLKLIKNDKETIDNFFETMSQTSDREGIVNHSYKYYKSYYETLHKENMSDLYVVTVDVKKLKETYKDKIKQIETLLKTETDIKDLFLSPKMLVDLMNMVSEGKISSKQSKEVMYKVLETEKEPNVIVKELGVEQISDDKTIRDIVVRVLDAHPDLIEDHRKGKNTFDFFVGQVMKETRGKANPSLTTQIIREEIEKR